jgi:hypothetical protein
MLPQKPSPNMANGIACERERDYVGMVLVVLKNYESVAVWLEGVALIAIFFLDLSEYRKQGKDRKEQHAETLEQLRIMQEQAKATSESVVAARQQADSASGSLRLLRTQWLAERHRELLRGISILDEIRSQVRYWADITDSKWGTATEASAILPADSNTVLIQAARHSKDLRNEVRETFRMLANADRQIAHFYSQPHNYRQDNLITAARLKIS